jgi:hypothetical protein
MNKLVDVVASIVVVAGIFTLVRPGSQGPKFVGAVGSAFATMINAATGGGSYHIPPGSSA